MDITSFSFDGENSTFIDNKINFLNLQYKKVNYKSFFLSPYLSTFSDNFQLNNSYDIYFEKDLEDSSYLFPINNIIDLNSLKEEEKIEESNIKEMEYNDERKFLIKKQVFNIRKEKKKGRNKKNCLIKGKHSKFRRDNVIRRFKAQFIQNIFKYINKLFKCNNRPNKKPINILQKICSKGTKSISKEDNLKWFSSKIKFIVSQNVTTKLSFFELNYNNKLINRIYEKGEEKKVIEILEKTIKDMWEIYKNDDKENKHIGFNTIKYDTKKFKELGETEEYIELYVSIVNNFETIFNNIKARKKRK